MYRKYLLWILAATFIVLQGCGGSGDSETALIGLQNAGKVDVSITDAPAYGFDHVWITVRDLWFHKSDTAEAEQAGWIKFPLSAPVTLDLLELANGAISVPVWEDIELPEGDYTQMRVFLVRTEAALASSTQAETPPLMYNNQVDVTDGAAYPLRVPAADRGIMLTGQFTVKKNEKLKLAVDFDAGNDVVKIEHDGKTEYILKPRLAYFNLDNAGAIVGSIDEIAANDRSAQFVIKAEQIAPNGQVHIVRRVTALADPTGKFVLFPLLPGSYDIVMRGINYRTVIVKGVPVTKDTKPDLNATVIPKVTMTKSTVSDHPLDVTIVSPTGAWVDFFQKLPGNAAPYEIRFRHFNPLTGRIIGFPLSSDSLRVGTYAGNTTEITFETVSPEGGNGSYRAVAGAPLHTIDLSQDIISSATTTLRFDTLEVESPLADRKVTGSITVPETIDRGVLFACHGGMIVNAINLDDEIASDGTYTISNLPGGTADHPLPGAFYEIDAFGWLSTNPLNRAIAIPRFVNLTTTDATEVDLTMMLP